MSSKEKLEEKLVKRLEGIIDDFSDIMDDRINYSNKDEEEIEIDIDSINLLEAAFLLLCEKCDYPLEIVRLLFSHNEKYEKRLTHIILSKVLDDLGDKGLVKKMIDEENGEISYMTTEYYEKTIK